MYDLSHMRKVAISGTPDCEFEARRNKVAKVLEEKGLDTMVFFSASSIFYLTGSSLIQTERPVVFIYKTDGQSVMFVPRLELEHVEEYTKNCKVVCYSEYPTLKHPMEYLKETITAMGLENASIAADGPGYPSVSGYQGPSLQDMFPGMKITLLPRLITEMKIFKSPFEIKLMHESGRWANLAQRLLQEYTLPGLTETEISVKASGEATRAMVCTLGHDYKVSGADEVGVRARYRGQIGPNSYFPHARPMNLTINKGDSMVTGVVAYVQGYSAELERVLFTTEPTKEQAHYYKMAVEAQDAAFSMIKPGAKCSDVDKEMLKFFEQNNLMEYWRHHTGHSIGSGGHEAPFFDAGDDTIIQPGMCFTVEPGIYVKGLGGFRLSDTLVVTETGFDLITYYTRDINNLVCGK